MVSTKYIYDMIYQMKQLKRDLRIKCNVIYELEKENKKLKGEIDGLQKKSKSKR
tara:strand:+ start:2033 stop:2194 length:162 start_codon:yes stop_codon:yes gene_type:complete